MWPYILFALNSFVHNFFVKVIWNKRGNGDGDGTFLETSKGGLEAWGRAWGFFMATRDKLKLKKKKKGREERVGT